MKGKDKEKGLSAKDDPAETTVQNLFSIISYYGFLFTLGRH